SRSVAVKPAGERGFLRRREKAQRDIPDGRARTQARGARRNRLGPGYRCPKNGRRRGERDALARARDRRHHPLPAAAELYRARCRPRTPGRQDRPVRRQGTGTAPRGKRLWLDRSRAPVNVTTKTRRHEGTKARKREGAKAR